MLRKSWFWSVLLLSGLAVAGDRAEAQPETPKAEPSAPAPPGQPTRIDFDDRMIQGQSNQSGALYLLEKAEPTHRSMVRTRMSFRHLTLRSIYDR